MEPTGYTMWPLVCGGVSEGSDGVAWQGSEDALILTFN